MIKKTIKTFLKLFFALIFIIVKKIFIRENRIPNKTMDSFADKLHSIFIYSSFTALYLLWFEIEIYSFSLNSLIYTVLFLQMVLITRYFNQNMLIVKYRQVRILKLINRFSLFIFILNWIFLSFGLAFFFLIVLLLNNIIYLFIINQINKHKEQEEFKKQFGEGSYSKDDIVKTHIENLFESNISIGQLTKSDIKKQYRLMAKRYHPDVYKGDSEDKFTSINSSYKFLIDLKIKEQNRK
ncbi:MAG: DnaJ domain-containing protein [Campylobacterota bacterium]|nr:DnaJ domain-containing protein [Campylobacterota bacterium]